LGLSSLYCLYERNEKRSNDDKEIETMNKAMVKERVTSNGKKNTLTVCSSLINIRTMAKERDTSIIWKPAGVSPCHPLFSIIPRSLNKIKSRWRRKELLRLLSGMSLVRVQSVPSGAVAQLVEHLKILSPFVPRLKYNADFIADGIKSLIQARDIK